MAPAGVSIAEMRWLVLLALFACSPPPTPPASVIAERPRPPATCDDDDRLVVDWSPLDRAKLESSVRRGVVLVHAEGCRARIVDTCTTKRSYAFSATSRQREVMLVRDEDELGAKLPVLATRFGAAIGRSSALDVTMTVVGRYEAGARAISTSDLEGACEDVTHAVASVSVGAFSIATADATRAEADFHLAAAKHAHEKRHLDSAGVEERCAEARRTDEAPPEDCGIPLRVELRALGAGARPPPPPLDMKKSMELARRQLTPCHRSARASAPNLSGMLTLSLKLGRRGNVRSVAAKTEGDLPDELTECATSRIAMVMFPEGEDDRPRALVLPVLFRPLAAP